MGNKTVELVFEGNSHLKNFGCFSQEARSSLRTLFLSPHVATIPEFGEICFSIAGTFRRRDRDGGGQEEKKAHWPGI
jgi:hypothetical protein